MIKSLKKIEKNLSNPRSLITINEPLSIAAESYKLVHTNIHYMGVASKIKVILLTSALPGEGKTTTAMNLAITYAQSGLKTILVDCDLRRARVHKVGGLKQEPGLTNFLSDQAELKTVIHDFDKVEHLHVITGGHLPPSPTALLESDQLTDMIQALRDTYDMVIIDAPPILNVTDGLILQHLVDGTILVVAAKETKKDAVIKAKRHLDQVGANLLGTILTKVDIKSKHYYYHYLPRM